SQESRRPIRSAVESVSSSMPRPVFALVALTIFLPTVVAGHDFWIEPSTFRPAAGDSVTAALRVGQKLQGDTLPRIPPLIDRFFLKGGGAEVPVIGRAGADPAGFTRVADAGLQWLAYQSNAFPVTLDGQKFE